MYTSAECRACRLSEELESKQLARQEAAAFSNAWEQEQAMRHDLEVSLGGVDVLQRARKYTEIDKELKKTVWENYQVT